MTHSDAFINLDILLDKNQAPWHSPREKEFILLSALTQWTKVHYRDFENKEKRRQDLDTRLVLKHTFGGGITTINLNTPPKFFLIASLTAYWNFICKGTTTTRGIPVVPAKHDEIDVMKNDPHNVPTNAFPVYTQYFNGSVPVAVIHSDSPPLQTVLTYIKTPNPILSTTPNATCELPDWAMDEVLLVATRIALGVEENFQRQQEVAAVEIPSSE